MVRRQISFSILFLFLSVGVSPGQSNPDNVSARATVDKPNYLVGDYINYQIVVDCDTTAHLITPVLPDSMKGLVLIKTVPVAAKESEGDVNATFGFILSAYDSAQYVVPPVAVPYRMSGDTTVRYAYSNLVSFTVSKVKVDAQTGIKDVKTPLTIPLDWRWILLWVLIIVLLAAITFYVIRQYRKKKLQKSPARAAAAVPPHVTALNELHALEDKKLWQKGLVKEYHSSITEIIRRYFENRFSMPAMELPTSEAVEALRKREGTAGIIGTTHDFLSNADLVKFAKFTPLDSVNQEMLKQAYEIVNKTIPVPVANERKEVNDVR